MISRRKFLASACALPAAAAVAAVPARRQPPPAPVGPPQARPLPERLFTPAEGVKLAAVDAAALKEAAVAAANTLKLSGKGDDAKDVLDQVISYRYLYLGNVHPAEREDVIRLIDFTLNSLSTRKVMVFCSPLPGAENAVVRVKLDEYVIDPKAWDELGAKGSGVIRSVKKLDDPDPWFHYVVRGAQVKGPGRKVTKKVQERDERGRLVYYLTDGKADTSKPVMVDKEEMVYDTTEKDDLQHAPWISAADIATLALAVETDFPILRADWFIINALTAPAYYRFFNVKSLADLQKLARFSRRDDDLATRGVVSDSAEVAIHQRATQFTPTPLGWWNESFDYLTSVRADDLLNDLRLHRRDAGEFIFNLPNGLQGYGLANDSEKNELIDSASTDIATDTRTPLRRKTVDCATSCITCHDEGLKPVVDEVRLLSNEVVALLVKSKSDFKAVVDLFSTPVDGPDSPIARGQAMYARAVAAATRGWVPKRLAARLSELIVRYVQEPVTLDVAALDTGARPQVILDVIGNKRGPDHTLSQLYKKRPVRRDQWTAGGFAQLMISLYPAGVPLAQKK